MSNFLYNTVTENGGCFSIRNNTFISISKSNFVGNVAGEVGGVLYATKENIVYISDSIFVANVAKFALAVIEVIDQKYMEIIRCSFTKMKLHLVLVC